MKYRTTIQLITEARDKTEALEIASEYLVGNLSSGVDMRLSAKPAYHNAVKVASAVTVAAMVMIAVLVVPQARRVISVNPSGPATSAIQPPLKTSADRLSAEFKKEWQVRQTAEALNIIRQ